MFDVIVIGAGPAGSTASKVLTEKGFHVLLAERLKMNDCDNVSEQGEDPFESTVVTESFKEGKKVEVYTTKVIRLP